MSPTSYRTAPPRVVVDHHNTPADARSQPAHPRRRQWRSISPVVDATEIARLGTSKPAHTASALLGSDINRSLGFFFGLLLTMIIVLHDRFLAERSTRTAIA